MSGFDKCRVTVLITALIILILGFIVACIHTSWMTWVMIGLTFFAVGLFIGANIVYDGE
ncbi:MAG: hypothetical protein MN733_13360 [Nitrososphaera sp.]|nr:hypothetical protein [Nitrososphaera sp.]